MKHVFKIPLIFIGAFLLNSCYRKIPVPEQELMGKSKEKILAIAFEKAPRNFKNKDEIFIGIPMAISSKEKATGHKKTFMPKSFFNYDESIKDEELMDAHMIRIFYTKIISYNARLEYYILYFKYNKVYKIEKAYMADFEL